MKITVQEPENTRADGPVDVRRLRQELMADQVCHSEQAWRDRFNRAVNHGLSLVEATLLANAETQ